MRPHRRNTTTPKRGKGKINIHITLCQPARTVAGSHGGGKSRTGAVPVLCRERYFPSLLIFFWCLRDEKRAPSDAEPGDLRGALLRQGLSACPDWGAAEEKAFWEGFSGGGEEHKLVGGLETDADGARTKGCNKPPAWAKKSYFHPGFGAVAGGHGASICLCPHQGVATVTDPISSVPQPAGP